MDDLNNILFHACRDRKVEVIKFIVQNNPILTTKKDKSNNTALHVACEHGLELDAIACLYLAFPPALNMLNDEGASPFHMACFHGKSIETISFLHGKSPTGLLTANENGDLPIHWVNETATAEFVKCLLELSPKSAEVKNKEDALPIHIACNKELSLNVIRVLYEAYPLGILQRDNEGILPIHDACEGVPNLDLIKFFLEVCPSSFEMSDGKGNLPLHYAICSSPEVVHFVIEANKMALKTPNKYGHLPIHKACSLSVGIDVIKALHEPYPEGIKTRTCKGLLPFHLAITSLPTLTYLHDLYDEAVRTPDNKGRYPIHIACDKGAPSDVITFLTKKYPLAVRELDHSQMLPLHHAIINDLPAPIIKHLVKLYPEALRCADASNHLPFHLVFLHCNDLEVFRFLRLEYAERFEELMVQPVKRKYKKNVSTLDMQQQRSIMDGENKKRASPDLNEQQTSSNGESLDQIAEQGNSIFQAVEQARLEGTNGAKVELNGNSHDFPTTSTIQDYSPIRKNKTRASKSLQGEMDNLNNYDLSTKRRRTNNFDYDENSSSFKMGPWSKDESDAFMCSLRDYNGEKRKDYLFPYISQKMKTRNRQQCYDFAYRIKLKVEKGKHYTEDEFMIYNIVKQYDVNKVDNVRNRPKTEVKTENGSVVLVQATSSKDGNNGAYDDDDRFFV